MRALLLFLTCCFYIFVGVLIPVFGLFGSFLLGVPICSWAFIGAYVLFVVVSCIVISCRMGLYCVPVWCVVRVLGVFPFRVIVLVSCFICVLVCSCSFLLVLVLLGVGLFVVACWCAGRFACRFF